MNVRSLPHMSVQLSWKVDEYAQLNFVMAIHLILDLSATNKWLI